jgi:glucose uptake protein GlcU
LITREKTKESVTQIPVHIPASFGFIIWGFLLNTPKSNARKRKIVAKKIIQTIMFLILSYKYSGLDFQSII